MNPIIQMDRIVKSYDKRNYVLNGLSFSISEGEYVVVVGKSGSGKSTFLNIVGLLDVFDSGSYLLKDRKIVNRKLNQYSKLRGDYIGFVFQSYYLIENYTVMENMLMPFLYCSKKINDDTRRHAADMLEEFQLSEFQNKKAALLSGGQKQRVAIARAILKDPKIIIADEPTGNLDGENSAVIDRHFRALADKGKAVIVVTHNESAFKEAGKRYFLYDGKLACDDA